MNGEASLAFRDALPTLAAALWLAGILVAAGLLHLPFRIRARSSGAGPGARFLDGLLYPAWVLTLGRVAVSADLLGTETRDAPVLAAWTLFWGLVLGIKAVDETARFLYTRRARAFPVPPLLHRGLLAVLYAVAALAVLRMTLDVDITPLLATSAVLTMVLGFALQGVLGNLLSGMSMSLVKTVKVGDLIGVGDLEGIVVHTNWRETILRTRDDDYVHVPNNTLASEPVTNFSDPDNLHRFSLDVGASYSDAPDEVLEALVEAARESGTALDHPAPRAHIVSYADFGINYRLHFWSREYWRKAHVPGEVARHVWYKFKRRGIEIPFPMSDQLLNDFMAVVYHQRRLPPSDTEAARMADVLRSSEFLTREEDGHRVPILDDEAVGELVRRCRLVRYTKDEILVRQGDRGDSCFIVARGEIHGRVAYAEDGRTHHMDFVAGPGKVFGEMSLMTGAPRTATGTFAAETELLEIPGEAFGAFLARHEPVMEEIAATVAARNRANQEFLEKLREFDASSLEEHCDSGSILRRLRGLAGWGKRLLG